MGQMNLRFLGTLPAPFALATLVSNTLLVCLLASATNVQAQGWSATGPLGVKRDGGHTSTLLKNGKVLSAGGSQVPTSGRITGSAELYDPTTGQWHATGGLTNARLSHIAVRLTDGRVLVAGGSTNDRYYPFLASAEIYDPETGAWSPAGSLGVRRFFPSATLLADGRVLVTGGSGDVGEVGAGSRFRPVNSAELYDPVTNTWSPTGDMISARYGHTSTLLPNGKVLVAGGLESFEINHPALRSAELYDPATGIWTSTGDLITARGGSTATLLPNNKVLVAGGAGVYSHDGFDLESAELYDTITGQWSATGSLLAARGNHTATLLPNGTVLVAAGFAWGPIGSAELYDPATESWSVAPNLNTARSSHTATFLANGKLLVAGGYPAGSSTELYDAGFEIPLVTLNSSSYCIGAPWSLAVTRSPRAASVQLLGVSNGASWEIEKWGLTGDDGSFRANGIIAAQTAGTHSLRVEIRSIRSNELSFAVSQCP